MGFCPVSKEPHLCVGSDLCRRGIEEAEKFKGCGIRNRLMKLAELEKRIRRLEWGNRQEKEKVRKLKKELEEKRREVEDLEDRLSELRDQEEKIKRLQERLQDAYAELDKIEEKYDKLVARYESGLSPKAKRLLHLVADYGMLTGAEIERMLGVSRPTRVRLVKELESQGLVVVTRRVGRGKGVVVQFNQHARG